MLVVGRGLLTVTGGPREGRLRMPIPEQSWGNTCPIYWRRDDRRAVV